MELKNARLWSNQILHKICRKMEGDIINVSGERDSDKGGRTTGTIFPMRHHILFQTLN